MKQLIRKTLAAFFICSLLTCAAQAQTKIGLIDLRKVFDNYYKTKQADVTLKEEAAGLEKEIKQMVEDFKKGEAEWKKLLDKANDQAVSAEERASSKQAAESKLRELKELEQIVAQFQRSSKANLTEKQRRKRDAILLEIREVVNAKAKAGNFTMVVDSAASSMNDTPIVMYTNGDNDLTDLVLSQLNASAPPGSLTPTKPADEKK